MACEPRPVEKTLAGDEGSIKAYSVAVDVFGRPQSFDPQSDPIVRVQARRLRTLLEQFYESGEARSAVAIDFRSPRRSWFPGGEVAYRASTMNSVRRFLARPSSVSSPACVREYSPPVNSPTLSGFSLSFLT